MSDRLSFRDEFRELIAQEAAKATAPAGQSSEPVSSAPDFQEMENYLEGRLNDAAEVRFQEYLLHNPTAARAFLEFQGFREAVQHPTAGPAKPEKMEADRQLLKQRLGLLESDPTRPDPLPSRLVFWQGLAATLGALCLGLTFYLASQTTARHDAGTVESLSALSLSPEERLFRQEQEVPSVFTVTDGTRKLVLILAFEATGRPITYRLRIVPQDGKTAPSMHSDLAPSPEGPFVLVLDPHLLGQTTARLEILPPAPADSALATYEVEVLWISSDP